MRYPWHATYNLRLFFTTIMMEISKFHFWTSMSQGGNFSKCSIIFLWDLWKGTGDYWYNHGMLYINLVCFFPTKTIGIIKIHFGHCVENTTLVLNNPISFMPGLARCSSVLCLFYIFLLPFYVILFYLQTYKYSDFALVPTTCFHCSLFCTCIFNCRK